MREPLKLPDDRSLRIEAALSEDEGCISVGGWAMSSGAIPTSEQLNSALAKAFGISKEFECPRCGSTHFGTVNPLDSGGRIIECHDQHMHGCKWRGSWEDVAYQRFDSDWDAFGELLGSLEGRGCLMNVNGPAVDRVYRVVLTRHGVKREFSDSDLRRAGAMAAYLMSQSPDFG